MAKLPVAKLKASKKPIPVKIVSDAPEVSTERDNKWRAEDALRDIERAEAHKRDKSLMADVKKLAQDKVKALKDLC